METSVMRLTRAVFAVALLAGSSGLALAQSTAQSPTTTSNPQNTPIVSPSPPAARDPGVNPNAAGTATAIRNSGTSSVPGSGNDALEKGTNSYTEGQARRRMEDHGYTNVGQLRKDQDSIWQAEAMKDGRRARVGVDFRGNVVEEKR
jgi:hypothetical protein